MLTFIAFLFFITFVVGLIVAMLNLHAGSKNGGVAAHAERVATSHYDWKASILTMGVLYVFLFLVGALIYATGFGSILLTLVALVVNINLGSMLHRIICLVIWKKNGAPVPMPAAV